MQPMMSVLCHAPAAIELLAEGMTLADATGLPRDLLLQFLHLMLPGAPPHFQTLKPYYGHHSVKVGLLPAPTAPLFQRRSPAPHLLNLTPPCVCDCQQDISLMGTGVVFEGYGARMAADDFDRKGGSAGFSVTGGIKDVGHMQKLAAEKKVHHSFPPSCALDQCVST